MGRNCGGAEPNLPVVLGYVGDLGGLESGKYYSWSKGE